MFNILGIQLLTYFIRTLTLQAFTCALNVQPKMNLKVKMLLVVSMKELRKRLKTALLSGAVRTRDPGTGVGALRHTEIHTSAFYSPSSRT